VAALAPHLDLREDFDDLDALYPNPCQLYPLGLFTVASPHALPGLLAPRDHLITTAWSATREEQASLCGFFLALWDQP